MRHWNSWLVVATDHDVFYGYGASDLLKKLDINSTFVMPTPKDDQRSLGTKGITIAKVGQSDTRLNWMKGNGLNSIDSCFLGYKPTSVGYSYSFVKIEIKEQDQWISLANYNFDENNGINCGDAFPAVVISKNDPDHLALSLSLKDNEPEKFMMSLSGRPNVDISINWAEADSTDVSGFQKLIEQGRVYPIHTLGKYRARPDDYELNKADLGEAIKLKHVVIWSQTAGPAGRISRPQSLLPPCQPVTGNPFHSYTKEQ